MREGTGQEGPEVRVQVGWSFMAPNCGRGVMQERGRLRERREGGSAEFNVSCWVLGAARRPCPASLDMEMRS